MYEVSLRQDDSDNILSDLFFHLRFDTAALNSESGTQVIFES